VQTGQPQPWWSGPGLAPLPSSLTHPKPHTHDVDFGKVELKLVFQGLLTMSLDGNFFSSGIDAFETYLEERSTTHHPSEGHEDLSSATVPTTQDQFVL
jgi:hypothetical protein